MPFPVIRENNIPTAIVVLDGLRTGDGGNGDDPVSQNISPFNRDSSLSPPPSPPLTTRARPSTPTLPSTATADQTITPPPPPSSPEVITGNAKRGRRYRFDRSADVVLLRCVSDAGAHVCKWGQTDALFDGVLKSFYENNAATSFESTIKPTKKTLIDRYRRLMQKRKETVAMNIASSGIAEMNDEADDIMDDLIVQVQDMEERRKSESEELRGREAQLVKSSALIRENAIRRRSSVDEDRSDDIEIESEIGGSDGTPSSTRKRRRIRMEEFDDNIPESLKEDLKIRQQLEAEKLELEKESIKMQRERVLAENRRYEKIMETNERRMEIEQKRLELDAKERKDAALERSKVVDVLSLLAEQLRKK